MRIGKRSEPIGTNYYLRINPCSHCERSDEILNSLDDWKKKFQEGIIKDEYQQTITVDEMIKIITERRPIESVNCSIRGPNVLARNKIDYNHCVGYGEGTWDLIIGEFS